MGVRLPPPPPPPAGRPRLSGWGQLAKMQTEGGGLCGEEKIGGEVDIIQEEGARRPWCILARDSPIEESIKREEAKRNRKFHAPKLRKLKGNRFSYIDGTMEEKIAFRGISCT